LLLGCRFEVDEPLMAFFLGHGRKTLSRGIKFFQVAAIRLEKLLKAWDQIVISRDRI
jgi:hypothetical protein